MAVLSSQLILSLTDKVTAPARGIARAVSNMQSQLAENNRRLDAMRGRMFETGLVAVGLFKALGGPIRAAADFEAAMNQVAAVSGASSEQLEAFKRQAKDLGATTQFSASQAADAMKFLAMAGFDANAVMASLPGTLQLAAAAQLDLGSAADIVSNVLSGYGLQVEEIGRVNDVLVKAFTSSNTDLRQLAEAMKYAGPVANAAGVQFEETAAALGLMGNAGIQASMAGTSLRSAISRSLSPTKKMRAVMKRAGLDFTDANGRLISLDEMIRQLEPHAADAGLFMELFGQRAGPAMAALVSQGADALEDLTTELENSAGTAQRISDVQMQGFWGMWKEIKSVMEAVGIAIGDALLPSLTEMGKTLAPMIRNFAKLAENNPAVTRTIIGLTVALVALRVASLAAQFSFLWMRGAALASAIGGLQVLQGVMAGMRIALLSVLNPMRLVRGAMVLLRAAFLMTGIGAVIAAIALGGLWIYNNWANIGEAFNTFKKSFLKAINPVEKALEPVTELFGGLLEFVTGLVKPIDDVDASFARFGSRLGTTVGSGLRSVVEFFRDLPGIIDGSIDFDWSALGRRIVDGIKAGLDWAWSSLKVAWDWAGKLLSDFADSDLVQGLREKFDAIDWTAALTGAGDMAGALFNWMADQFRAIDAAKLGADVADVLVMSIKAAFEAIGVAVDALSGGTGNEMQNALAEAMGKALTGMGEVAKALIRGVFDFNAAFWAEIFGIPAPNFDAVIAGFNDLLDFIEGVAKRIKTALDDVGAAIRSAVGLSESNPGTAGAAAAGAAIGSSIAGQRAMGGPVAAAKTYLVGERGPELFTPNVSGNITDARTTAAMSRAPARAGGGGGAPNITFGNIIIQGGANATADQLRREFERGAGDLIRSQYSDGGM